MTSRPTRSSFPAARRLVHVLALGSAALGLSSCALLSPFETTGSYEAANGVPVSMGDVQIHDLVVVSDKKGAPGNVVGQVINTGDSEQTILVADGSSSKVTTKVPAHTTERLGGDTQVVLPSVPVDPGALVSLQVMTQTSGVQNVAVPVLPATSYYATLSPTATFSGTATPGPPPSK